MKALLFFTFFAALAKSGLWIGIGFLIKNHFNTLLSLIIRKPIPEDLIDANTLKNFNIIIKWIGIFIIIIGIAMALPAFATLKMGLSMPTLNINF